MMRKILRPFVCLIVTVTVIATVRYQQTVYADIDDYSGHSEPCPQSGIWPAGCVPGTSGGGQPCPAFGVWPQGCIPSGSGSSGNAAGQPCPANGIWPAGCVPNGGGAGTGSGAGQPCPGNGVWPAGCVPPTSSSPTPYPPPSPAPDGPPPGAGEGCAPDPFYDSYYWVFSVRTLPVPSCANTPAEWGDLAEQPFENGWMVWSEAYDVIYVFMASSPQDTFGSFDSFRDNFDESVHPISDPSIVPPAGLRQPTYGFGKVWRENPYIREALGWALPYESNYEGYLQSYGPLSRYDAMAPGGTFMSGADGFVWQFGHDGIPPRIIYWTKTTIPNPQFRSYSPTTGS